jgi:hypothetical protein
MYRIGLKDSHASDSDHEEEYFFIEHCENKISVEEL